MLISVIIPCYNVEDYIEECLESVFEQEYQNLEVICVDNDSSDHTYEKLCELKACRFSQIILLSELKKGASAARNRGLSVARGEWIQFLDADDLLYKEKIHRQVHLVKRLSGQIDFIVSGYERQTLDKKIERFIVNPQDIYVDPFICRCGNTCSNLWKRKSLLAVGGWNETIQSSQESELMMRLVVNGAKYAFSEAADVLIRERASGQISQADGRGRWDRFIAVRVHFIEKLKQFNLAVYEERRGVFLSFLFSSILVLSEYDRISANKHFLYIRKEGWKGEGGFGVSRWKAILVNRIGLKSFIFISALNKWVTMKFSTSSAN